MIGLFDSGSGGLTVLKEIKRLAPKLDVVYFGDFARLPYGEKTPEELGALTTIDIERLLKEGAENIVSACNSISASVAQPLIDLLGREQFGMVEMVGPTVRAVITSRPGKKIGLVATPATVASGMYRQAFADAGVSVEELALPGLVDAIEFADAKEVETIVASAKEHLALSGIEVLVLGCTQYPLVQDVFENHFSGVNVFNPGVAVAETAVERFGGEGSGTLKFIISKDSSFFRSKVDEFFGDVEIEIL